MESFAPQKKRLKTIWFKGSESFGDTVAKITKTFGIQPCKDCEQRRKKFNKAIHYRNIRRKLQKLKEKLLRLFQ